ncbi:LytTr DNA-binding domain protein [compost metagenome]
MKIPLISESGPAWLDINRLMAVTITGDKLYFTSQGGVYEAPTSLKHWEDILQNEDFTSASRSSIVRPDLAVKYDRKENILVFDTKRGYQLIKVSRSNQKKMEDLF